MTNQAANRPVPARTCVGCRQVRGKREMVRLVRNTEGVVEIDPSGKMNGRGAYICQTRTCWEKALKGKQLEIKLRGSLTDDNRIRLRRQSEDIIREKE